MVDAVMYFQNDRLYAYVLNIYLSSVKSHLRRWLRAVTLPDFVAERIIPWFS